MSDVIYIYTKEDEVSDGYYSVPEVIGVWDNKYELMRYINKHRQETWNELVRDLIGGREELTNVNYDYGIYREYSPQLYITQMVKNEGHWLSYDDLVNHSSHNEKWYTYPQKMFFEMNLVDLWIPSIDEQNAVITDVEVKKKKDMDKEDRTRFINLFRKFKEQGKINEILEDVNK